MQLDMTNLQHKIVHHATGAQCTCAPNWNYYYCCLFSKLKTKQDDGDVFWWVFGHISLLKLEKYVEDDNC